MGLKLVALTKTLIVGQAMLPAAGFRAGLLDGGTNPDLSPIANRPQVTNLPHIFCR
jgi:hypothetical protein